MGQRNLAGLLAALAMQPHRVEAGGPEVKDIPNGTFMLSRKPNDPDVTALVLVVGPGPVEQPGMHLAYLELPYPDGTFKNVFGFVEDSMIETTDRTDPTFAGKANAAAGRLLTNRDLLPALFNQSKRWKLIAEICEQNDIGVDQVRINLPATPIGKFVRATQDVEGTKKERFGLCIGAELYDARFESYGVLVAYRPDSEDVTKVCKCGKTHDAEPGALNMVMVDVGQTTETSDMDASIRLDAMRAVGADVSDRRRGGEYEMMKMMGLANGVSDFCEGTRFADECLAEYNKLPQEQPSQTEQDFLSALDANNDDNID